MVDYSNCIILYALCVHSYCFNIAHWASGCGCKWVVALNNADCIIANLFEFAVVEHRVEVETSMSYIHASDRHAFISVEKPSRYKSSSARKIQSG
jgi:hypothetical protein